MHPDDFHRLARELVYKATDINDSQPLIFLLHGRRQEEVKRLVEATTDDAAPFLGVCPNGCLWAVRNFVEVALADVETSGTVSLFERSHDTSKVFLPE